MGCGASAQVGPPDKEETPSDAGKLQTRVVSQDSSPVCPPVGLSSQPLATPQLSKSDSGDHEPLKPPVAEGNLRRGSFIRMPICDKIDKEENFSLGTGTASQTRAVPRATQTSPAHASGGDHEPLKSPVTEGNLRRGSFIRMPISDNIDKEENFSLGTGTTSQTRAVSRDPNLPAHALQGPDSTPASCHSDLVGPQPRVSLLCFSSSRMHSCQLRHEF